MKLKVFTIGEVIDILLLNIELAKKDFRIQKPMAWSLYQTWKWFDEHEQGGCRRKDGEQDG